MATTTLYPTHDTFVDQSNPTTNYDSNANILMSPTKRGWLKFDLSGIPSNSYITSATLHVFMYIFSWDYSDLTYNVQRCSNTTWDEATLTWNNAPNSQVSPTVTATIYHPGSDPTAEYYPNLTADVNDAMVEGQTAITWRIASADSNANEWGCFSHENDSLIYLTVNYVSGTVDTVTTTGSSTWTCPTGVTTVDVHAWGAGGGGMGGYGSIKTGIFGGDGGGGGAYSKKKAYSVTPSTGYTVSVGAGGTAGSSSGGAGGTGGDTYFNTTGVLLAKGGKGGGNPDGAGGADSSGVGDTKYSGGQGSYGAEAEIGIGGGAAGTVYAGSFTTQGEFIGGAGGNPGAVPGGGVATAELTIHKLVK